MPTRQTSRRQRIHTYGCAVASATVAYNSAMLAIANVMFNGISVIVTVMSVKSDTPAQARVNLHVLVVGRSAGLHLEQSD